MTKTDDFEIQPMFGVEKLPFSGYNSQVDKTVLSPNYMVRGSKNVVRKLTGTIGARDGLKRRGEPDPAFNGIRSSFEWQNSLGLTRVIRVLEDGKMQVESNIADGTTYLWYTLITLANPRVVFDAWWNNTLKKDWLLFVAQDTDMYKWDGGIGVIAGTGPATITLTGDAVLAGFNSDGGTLIVNANPYTFTGVSGNDLTGVSGDPSGEAIGSVVLSGVTTSADTPDSTGESSTFTNDFIKVVGNRVHVGSYKSRIIYISADDDYTDYSVPSPRTPGSAELLTLDNLATGITVSKGNAWISAGLSDWYEIAYESITVGTDLTQSTSVDKKPTSELSAALAHEFIDTVGDDIVYLSVDQQLHNIGTFRNLVTPQFPTLSLEIKDELQAETFIVGDSSGHLRAIGQSVFVTAPINGKTYWYRNEQTVDLLGNINGDRYWQTPQIWSIQRVALIEGVVYGYSTVNPQLYQLFVTDQWHDDGADEEPLPYDCVARFAYYNGGRRQGKIQFSKAYFEGYMTQGTNLYGYEIFDYLGSTSILSFIINEVMSAVSFFVGPLSPSLGDSPIGDNPLGDGLVSESEVSQESLPKFRTMIGIAPVQCFEYQTVVYSQDLDSRWELLCYGTNATLLPIQATELNK